MMSCQSEIRHPPADTSSEKTEVSPVKTETSDKSIANVVAQHYNQIEEKGLRARVRSRIIHLRNFNNWIKSMLIAEYAKQYVKENDVPTLTVLDVGSGKGGDLLKWKKNDCGHLVCADIAEISVQQCKDRYMEMLRRHTKQNEKGECFTAEFIIADFGKDKLKDKYENSNVEFDIVSCQFAFHYCFESYSQAKTMIQNVSESLKPGGYFIGTIPDAYEIMKKLIESPDCTFGNDIYSVKFPSKDRKEMPLFGLKYDFQLEGVVDCPEFLVYFPAFVKMAKEYGNLELVFASRFDEYFDVQSKTREGDALLIRMKALETFPPCDSSRLMGGEDEYFFAEKTIESLQSNGSDENNGHKEEVRVGTLTKSEWEIVCMYMVFAFKKMEAKEEADSLTKD